MSLLMDALRKAEQQKQQGTASATPSAGSAGNGSAEGLSLEPLPEPASTPQAAVERPAPPADLNRHLPELPKRLEELDDQFLAADPTVQKSIRALSETQSRGTTPGAAAGKGIPPITTSPREAAQNVFAAKQSNAVVGNGFAIVVGAATLIAVAVIGGYFYWQLQPKGGLAAGPPMSSAPAPTPPTPAPSATTASSSPAVAPLANNAHMPTQGALEPDTSALGSQGVSNARKPAATVTKPARSESGPTSTLRSANTQAAASPPAPAANPDTGIHFSTRTRKVDNSMETAHAAFTRGDVEQARSLWMKALQNDSRNINALHGLAALAVQEGRPEQAGLIYRRVLEVDPKDAVANSGLVSLGASRDARQTESQLKGLLAEQPDSPHLNFSLGNLYMAESRWSEAQQAFFKAHVADPANPDFLYNLAVSLDHLHQARLAAQYYGRALAAARSQRATFDPARVEERMKLLQAEPR